MTTAPPPISIAEAMKHGELSPPDGPVVDVRETHTAWVLLTRARAYKVKKPVRMEFLDFSSLERRRAVCEEEVRVNRPLAATLGMRLRAVVRAADGARTYELAEADDARAVEYAIEMRRFDEDATLAARIEHGALRDEHVRAVARRLVVFHAEARVLTPADPAGDVRRACDHNMRELFAIVGDDDALVRRVLAAERFAGAFLVTRRAAFAARAAAGRIRDGHGDLRAEHVVLEDPLCIVDRLEFDPRLREIDVADDLAFLVMDLERLGAEDAARLLVASYRDAGGDPGSDALLSFYGAYRALVRCKVALLRAAQLGGDAAAPGARAQADDLLALAERFAWRARGPLVLAVSGPPASGKSTLARALAQRSGWPLLSSDVLRKRRRGLDLGSRAPADDYAPAARAAVYGELGAQARARLCAGQGVVVDATFGEAPLRAAFLEGLSGARELCAIECRAPAALRERGVRARTPAGAHGSDADAAVAARLAARFSGWDELDPGALLTLHTGVDADVLVHQLADWLDTRASVVCHAGARRGTEAAQQGPG